MDLMNEKMFECMAERLKADVSKEIAYAYAVFVPDDAEKVISKMKRNIPLKDRMFLGQDLQNFVGSDLIFPYDVLNSKIEKHIADFYDELSLSLETSKKLATYGNRGKEFERQFNERLNQSKASAISTVKHEMNLQMMQNKDAKSAIAQIQKVLTKRIASLESFLKFSAGQLEQYMLLWDYQDKGYTHYRIKTNGDNCEKCAKLDGKIFSLDEATSGENLVPFHPNCDCFVEVLDKNQNSAVMVESTNEDGEGTNPFGYLQTSLKQIIWGNYTEEVNLGGTLGQIGLGLLGVDVMADLRDIFYDITHFEMSIGHVVQTLVDVFSVLPLVGGLKYTDEAGDVLKGAIKHGDEAAELIKNSNNLHKAAKRTKPMTTKEALEAARRLGFEPTGHFSHGQPVFKKGNKYITPDVDSHIGGVWKMANSIKDLGSKKTRLGTYDETLKRIGD